MTELWSCFNLIINKVFKRRLQAVSSRPQIHRDIHRSEFRSSPVALGVLTAHLAHPHLGGQKAGECRNVVIPRYLSRNVPKDCFLRTLFHTCALRKQESGASGENEIRITQWIPGSWQSEPAHSRAWPSIPADPR